MAVGEAQVFPGLLTPALTLLFFPKPPTTFLTCFCRGERRKYARKFASIEDRTHNHQVMSPTRSPPGHPSGASDMLKHTQNIIDNLDVTLFSANRCVSMYQKIIDTLICNIFSQIDM